MTPVRWSGDSLAALDRIEDFIDQFDTIAAQRVIAAFVELVVRFGSFAMSGVGTGRCNVRMLSVPRYRYRLFYTFDDDEIVGIAIRHAARRGLLR